METPLGDFGMKDNQGWGGLMACRTFRRDIPGYLEGKVIIFIFGANGMWDI